MIKHLQQDGCGFFGFLVALALIEVSASAATVWYAATGSGASDANPGTAQQPVRSVAKAVSLAKPGDTVVFAGGTYACSGVTVPNGREDFPLRVNPGINAIGGHLAAYVDGQSLPGIVGVDDPARSTRQIQIDTSWLVNGSHTISLREFPPLGTPLSSGGQSVDSQPVTVITSNPVTVPQWQGLCQLAVNVNQQGPPSLNNYMVWFFNAGYPKAQDPFDPDIQISYAQGTAIDGTFIYSESPANLGFGAGDTDPSIYSFTEFTSQPWGDPSSPGDRSAANPPIANDPPYPDVGYWVATYDDAAIDYAPDIGHPISDQLDTMDQRWRHDDQLNYGWATMGVLAGTPGTLAIPPYPGKAITDTDAQTWPVRGALGMHSSLSDKSFFVNDLIALNSFVADPSSRNFYAIGHGHPELYMYFGGVARPAITHRFRFAFLDGCNSYSWQNYTMFGAVLGEVGLAPPVGTDPGGYLDTGFYEVCGLRPSAFVGNVTDEPGAYPVGDNGETETDPTTGLECQLRNVEAMANWHVQFLFFWTEEYYGLATAMNQAHVLAWEQTDGFFAPDPPDPKYLKVGTDYQGNPVIYSPRTCLKVAGYRYLHFNEFNHASDTW